MDSNLTVFLIMTVSIVGAVAVVVLTAWSRARSKRQLDSGAGADAAKVALLSAENDGLKGEVSGLKDRLAVLERIATDPAERTAREIESLR